jgi:hypothetical protein
MLTVHIIHPGPGTRYTLTLAYIPYMKYSLILLFGIFHLTGFSQQCDCEERPELKGIISCDKIIFTNQSKLYRQYSCDSSWLSFESRSGSIRILFSLERDLIELTERLGYQYVSEFQNAFLIKNRVVSGCCQPAEFLLFDKENGKLIKDFGTILRYSADMDSNVIVYFNHDSLNSIYVYIIESGLQRKVLLPKNRLDYTMRNSGESYPESLVEDVQIQDSVVSVRYKYQEREKKNEWFTDEAFIELK